jgi:hypothetical protein
MRMSDPRRARMEAHMQQQSIVQKYAKTVFSAGVLGILTTVASYINLAKDYYLLWYDPEYSDVEIVAIAQQQQRLQEKNMHCVDSMTKRIVEAEYNISIRYGVCSNDDVLIDVYPANKPAFQRWLSPGDIAGSGERKTSGLFPVAFAAAPRLDVLAAPMRRLAQVPVMTVCQAWENPSRRVRLIRVTNEGGKCFQERVNVLSGRVEYREEASCAANCQELAGRATRNR